MAKAKPQAPVASDKAVARKVKEGRVSKSDDTKILEKKTKADSDSESESDTSSDSNDDSNLDRAGQSESESDSGSDSDSDSGSSSESDNEDKSKQSKATASKINGTATLTNGKPAKKELQAGDIEDPTEGSESDDEDESDDDEDVPPKPTKATSAAAVGKKGKDLAQDQDGSESSSESSSGDSGSSSSDESESDDESESEVKTKKPTSTTTTAPAPNGQVIQKKRKAEDIELSTPKKTKSESQTNPNSSKTLFAGNLSWHVDDEWLVREFSEFGQVSARVVTNKDDGRSRGFGYIDFQTAEEAETALLAKNGTLLDSRPLNLDFSVPRPENNFTPRERADSRAQKFGDSRSPPSDTLWIGNLPFSTDSAQLQDVCSEHGTVISVRIPTDRETGAPKGFGYVSFASIEEATAALENLAGAEMGSRPMRVDFAPPRSNDGGSRGGGGGGGRGGMSEGNWRGGRNAAGSPRGGFNGGRGGGGDRGGFRGGRGGARGGRGGSTNRGGIGDFSGTKIKF